MELLIALWQAGLASMPDTLILLCVAGWGILLGVLMVGMGVSAARAPYDRDLWGQP